LPKITRLVGMVLVASALGDGERWLVGGVGEEFAYIVRIVAVWMAVRAVIDYVLLQQELGLQGEEGEVEVEA
jgi:hypothetical protein